MGFLKVLPRKEDPPCLEEGPQEHPVPFSCNSSDSEENSDDLIDKYLCF